MLEKIYEALDCSKIIINSGYRCPTYDKKIGGFVGQHGIGNAVDAVFYDKKTKVISTKIVSCVAQDLGLGGIANINKTYTAIHLDARTTRQWKGNEIVSNNTVTSDFYKYYGLKKEDVYKTTPVVTPTPTPQPPVETPKTFKAGDKVVLNNTGIYSSATATKSTSKKSGTYYIYNNEIINGRMRITNSSKNVGKTPIGNYVSGWIKVSDIK